MDLANKYFLIKVQWWMSDRVLKTVGFGLPFFQSLTKFLTKNFYFSKKFLILSKIYFAFAVWHSFYMNGIESRICSICWSSVVRYSLIGKNKQCNKSVTKLSHGWSLYIDLFMHNVETWLNLLKNFAVLDVKY